MPHRRAEFLRAFSLVELLVVISIIALLISILLPSLKHARDQAKSVHCGMMQRGLETGISLYFTEENDWIPGRNTTGAETWLRAIDLVFGDDEALQSPNVPVQTYDWMTPVLRLQTHLPRDRALRFYTLLADYRCAAVNFKALTFTSDAGHDVEPPEDNWRFEEVIEERGAYFGVSYLMPSYFQLWGKQDADGKVLAVSTHLALPFRAKAPADFFNVEMKRYQSRVNQVGTPAEKIAAADGTRYLPESPWPLDFDHHYDPELRHGGLDKNGNAWFGAFSSSGAFWLGSTAYGEENSPSQGRNLPLSYRHRDGLQAVFFDGHVEHISRRQSRKVDYWYPRGCRIKYMIGASTDFADYKVGDVIR